MNKIIRLLFILTLIGCNEKDGVEFSSYKLPTLKGNTSLNFGEVAVGESKSLNYEIRNVSPLKIHSKSFKLSSKEINTQNYFPFKLELGTCKKTLESIHKCALKITYTPTKQETLNTSIKILYKYDSVLESYMLIDNVQAKGTEVKISITSPMDGTYINLSNQSAFRVSGTCSGGGGGGGGG